MGWRRIWYRSGLSDGIRSLRPDPHFERIASAEVRKYYRQGKAAGAERRIVTSIVQGKCTRCGQTIRSGAPFCSDCGAPLRLHRKRLWFF
jgi:hypothetical protein